jgi:chorismate lyase
MSSEHGINAVTSSRGWWARRAVPAARLPVALRRVLLDNGSLTALVRDFCLDQPFSVRLLTQARQPVSVDERRLLAMMTGQWPLVREVYLCRGKQPLVFARSLVGPRGLEGAWRHLRRQGQRPLGATLFADVRVHRGPLEIGCLPPSHALCRRLRDEALMADGQHLWGRRSVFLLRGQPLLVSEFFLPAFVRVLEGATGAAKA